MARVNKPKKSNKNGNNKPVQKEVRRSNVVAQEESPKGEAFFKVVLWLMLAAFLAAATWLTVQTIINNSKKDDSFATEMVIESSDLEVIATQDAYKVSPNLSYNLKKAFDKKLDVYIYFYDSKLTDGTVYQEENKKIITELWKHVKEEEDKIGDAEYNFYYFEGFALFFFDISSVEEYNLDGFEEGNTSIAKPYLGEIIFTEEVATLHKGKAVGPKLNNLLESAKK